MKVILKHKGWFYVVEVIYIVIVVVVDLKCIR